MRIFLSVMFLLIFSLPSYATINKDCATAIEWWLKSQNKFEGAKISTKKNDDGTFSITQWEAQDVPKPTDEEVNNIVEDYQVYQEGIDSQKEVLYQSGSNKLKALGFSDSEIQAFLSK